MFVNYPNLLRKETFCFWTGIFWGWTGFYSIFFWAEVSEWCRIPASHKLRRRICGEVKLLRVNKRTSQIFNCASSSSRDDAWQTKLNNKSVMSMRRWREWLHDGKGWWRAYAFSWLSKNVESRNSRNWRTCIKGNTTWETRNEKLESWHFAAGITWSLL